MISNPQELSPTERKALAASLSEQLVTQIRRTEVQEISTRPREHMTLFGIEQATLELLDFIQDVKERIADLEALRPGEPTALTPALEESIADARAELEAANTELAKLAGQEVEKVDNIANLLRMCDRMIAHRKDERDRQNKMAKRWEAIKEGVEQVVMEALVLTERTRFDSPTNTLRMQRNGQPSVEITDGQAVQSRFIKITLEVTADRYKQMCEALPELSQFVKEKERTFALGEISKVLKAAKKTEDAARQQLTGQQLDDELKRIDRVRGAELRFGRHLRCE